MASYTVRLGRGSKLAWPTGSGLSSTAAASPSPSVSEGSLMGSVVLEETSGVDAVREGRVIIWLMMGLGFGWVRVKGSSSVKSLRDGERIL